MNVAHLSVYKRREIRLLTRFSSEDVVDMRGESSTSPLKLYGWCAGWREANIYANIISGRFPEFIIIVQYDHNKIGIESI